MAPAKTSIARRYWSLTITLTTWVNWSCCGGCLERGRNESLNPRSEIFNWSQSNPKFRISDLRSFGLSRDSLAFIERRDLSMRSMAEYNLDAPFDSAIKRP